MIKLFIIGASSKLARKFIMDNSLKNVSIFGTYHSYDVRKLFKAAEKKNILTKKFLKIDLRKQEDLNRISNILIKFNPDILINFSTIHVKRKKFEKINLDSLKKVFEVNFFSQIKLYLKICKKLNKLKKKVFILNINSKSTLNGGFKIYEYSTSKAATANLLKSLQREYKKIKFINFTIPSVQKTMGKDSISYDFFNKNLSNIIRKIKKTKKLKSEMII